MPRRCHWQPTREPSFGVLRVRVDLWFIRSVRVRRLAYSAGAGAGAGSPIFSLFLSSSSGLCFFPRFPHGTLPVYVVF